MKHRIFCDSTTPLAQFATAELDKYLCQICDGPVDCTFTLSEDKALCPEEFFITVKGDGVTLRAGKKGLLYAVYEFLERYCGCAFGAMNNPEVNTGEIIPHLAELNLPEEEYHHTPDLPYRTAIIQYNAWAGNADHGLNLPFFDWMAKNRYNRLLTWMSCYEQIKELGQLPQLEKRGISLTVGHHQAIYKFLPPALYRDRHPEYYRLISNGERYTPKDLTVFDGQWLLCSRNEECVQRVADNILLWLEENPLVDTIAFWPNDGKDDDCCCPRCSKYSKTENYLFFNNRLSRLIAETRPDVKIDALVYMDLWDCPSGVQLGDNMIIDVAMCTDTFRPYGERNGQCLLGTTYEKSLRDYREVCSNVVAYEYYMGNYSNYQKLVPAADEMQSIFAFMKKEGICGSGTQIECFNHWNNLFNFYCFGRTADDINLSVEDNMERFCRLFGKAAPVIAEIIGMCEDTQEGQMPMNDAGVYLVEHIDKQRVYDLFDTALAEADDPRARNNVRMMRMAFRYSQLEAADPVVPYDNKVPAQYEDKTGELAYMATHFDSFFANHTGYGIAIPATNRTDAPPPNNWYQFE